MTIDPHERLEQVLAWSRWRDYAGYDYADGTSSRLLQALPLDHPYLNLAFQETAKRSPLNIRPLLLVPKRRSFKGSGLFVSANLTAYEVTDRRRYHQEARRLGTWLLANRREDPFGWGHNHRIQTLDGTVERNTPSIVTVAYVVRGLLRLRQYGMDIPVDIPEALADLITEWLDFEERGIGASIDYRVDADADYTIPNANALGGALLTEVAAAYGEPSLLDLAEPLLEYVASLQAPSGGWEYADPPTASHLSMDNHHNGFVVESFLRYRAATGRDRFQDVIDRGLEFHRRRLFDPDGAPNWDESSRYPRDIHAAAQGIITFARAGDLGFARQIADWTDANLYRGDGRYGYRKGPFMTRRFTLMRWAQAWMARAMATLLERSTTSKDPVATRPIAGASIDG